MYIHTSKPIYVNQMVRLGTQKNWGGMKDFCRDLHTEDYSELVTLIFLLLHYPTLKLAKKLRY